MKLSPYGKREWMGGGAVALLLVLTGVFLIRQGAVLAGIALSCLAVAAWVALAAFFRVPNRTIPQEPAGILSPADGVVKDITTVNDHNIELFEGQPLLCIGIFLSVLDVHVIRAPCDFSVEYRKYKKGRFLDARHPRCAKENESLVIAGNANQNDHVFPVAVRQISGAIARRIVCDPQPDTGLQKGEIYGMIKFGSRTELYLPANEQIIPAVTIGDKVRAGTTTVACITN